MRLVSLGVVFGFGVLMGIIITVIAWCLTRFIHTWKKCENIVYFEGKLKSRVLKDIRITILLFIDKIKYLIQSL